jgi:hypothetical protein
MTSIRHRLCERHAMSVGSIKILIRLSELCWASLAIELAGMAKVPPPADFAE